MGLVREGALLHRGAGRVAFRPDVAARGAERFGEERAANAAANSITGASLMDHRRATCPGGGRHSQLAQGVRVQMIRVLTMPRTTRPPNASHRACACQPVARTDDEETDQRMLEEGDEDGES